MRITDLDGGDIINFTLPNNAIVKDLAIALIQNGHLPKSDPAKYTAMAFEVGELPVPSQNLKLDDQIPKNQQVIISKKPSRLQRNMEKLFGESQITPTIMVKTEDD